MKTSLTEDERRILSKISTEEEINIANNSPDVLIKEYKIKDSILLHIGTHHLFFNPDMDFTEIFAKIKEFNPDCVLFEMSDVGCNEMQSSTGDKMKDLFGENYVIYKKLREGVEVLGSDLDKNEALKILRKTNIFSEEEILAYEIYFYFPFRFRESKGSPINIMRKLSKDMGIRLTDNIISIVNSHTLNYLRKPFDKIDRRDNLSACPYYDDSIAKITRKIGELREGVIVENILKELERHGKVLAINGGNHVIRQEPFWRYKSSGP